MYKLRSLMIGRLDKIHIFSIKVFLLLIVFPLKARARFFPRRSVLYAGQAYYNAWYLSRALRKEGWRADVLNWDTSTSFQMYYHGEDYKFNETTTIYGQIWFYIKALFRYDVFHFSNAEGITFSVSLREWFKINFSEYFEIYLLKKLGKIVVYSNNACLDGVSQSAFSRWGEEPVCSICIWRTRPEVCSDEKNLAWGKFRNSVADYQCILGGNRVDYNDDVRVHEVPEFYCLHKDIWSPDLDIPDAFLLPDKVGGEVRLYHAVGHKNIRTSDDGVNIKSSHIYIPLIEKLKTKKIPLRLMEPTGIPNIDVRYLQVQADIFLDMLTYGWFGANVREAMMLGKPVICYIRPEWLDSVRKEIPDYANELPIVSATPDTVEDILLDLINNEDKRLKIGRRSREFAVKWHSSDAAGKRFNDIYNDLLSRRFYSEN